MINTFRSQQFIEVFYRPYRYWVEIWIYESKYCEIWIANYQDRGSLLIPELKELSYQHNGKKGNQVGKIYYHNPDKRFERDNFSEMVSEINTLMKIVMINN
ncbi:MAG: hypothetical protein JEZ14_08215 [Marinilabiliaceae bacterium]|nr:hypothetical protein [Marinilabiliaceae bacterium]